MGSQARYEVAGSWAAGEVFRKGPPVLGAGLLATLERSVLRCKSPSSEDSIKETSRKTGQGWQNRERLREARRLSGSCLVFFGGPVAHRCPFQRV